MKNIGLKNIVSLLMFLLTLLFVGCGEGGGAASSVATGETFVENETTTTENLPAASRATGIYVDAAPVSNLTYVCEGKEAQTDADGGFSCSEFPVSFYVGHIKIGEVTSLPNQDAAIFSQNALSLPTIATRHPLAVKLSTFLNLLDSDANSTNGIAISEESVSVINNTVTQETAFEKLSDTQLKTLEDQIKNTNAKMASSYQFVPLNEDEITKMLSIAISKSYHVN